MACQPYGRCGDEGRRHGRRRGDAPAPADLEPAEADGADRRQAVHGAHHRAAARARLRGRDRHGRLHAAGDPQLLRRRREPRRAYRVLGGGIAARDGRLGASRLGQARRDVSRHLGRRAVRLRPHQAREVPPQTGSGGDDRAQIRSEPAGVRDRRRGRQGPGGALPREAVVGTGVLGHDQHRRVRPRAGGARAHSARPAFRLLEGALSAAARDGAAHLRAADGRLLGGHRGPRPISAGEFRRARRARRAHGSRHPAARERVAGGGGGARRPRPGRRARADLELLPHRSRRTRRPVLGALGERDPARARTHRPLRDRRVDPHRPRVTRRGGDHRTLVRHPRARPAPGRGRGRRRGQDRRGERAHARRPRLSEQGGGERRPDLREPHLGVPRVLTPVREGRRGRPRQRRPHARDGLAAGGRVRNCASARRPHRREPGGARDLPHDRALDDRGDQLDRRGRRRPADASERSGAASSEDARLRRRLPRRLQLRRPGSRADPLLRGSRDPDHTGVPEGDREALLAR